MLSSSDRKRKSGSVIKPCLFASLVPAALLCFGALSLLLAHKSLGPNVALMEEMSTSKIISSMRSTLDEATSWSAPVAPAAAGDYFVQHPPDLYEEAFYLDDEADYDSFSHIYEDSHVLKLLANKTHQPFNVYRSANGSSVLTDAGQTHKVLTR